MSTVREVLTAEYGDDFARKIQHTAEVVNTYSNDQVDVLVFNLARSGDVHGYDSALEVSNYRELASRWEEFDLITTTWSNVDTIGLRLDDVAPDDLVEIIDALDNYPVLDESLMSDVEQEIIEEHWTSYGKSDTLAAVATALGVDVSDLTSNAEDIVYELVWGGFMDYGYGSGYPMMIDDSAVEFGSAVVAEWIAERFGTVATVTTWGDSVDSFDLTRANLIRSDVSVSA